MAGGLLGCEEEGHNLKLSMLSPAQFDYIFHDKFLHLERYPFFEEMEGKDCQEEEGKDLPEKLQAVRAVHDSQAQYKPKNPRLKLS